jgi:hypothetical protein
MQSLTMIHFEDAFATNGAMVRAQRLRSAVAFQAHALQTRTEKSNSSEGAMHEPLQATGNIVQQWPARYLCLLTSGCPGNSCLSRM